MSLRVGADRTLLAFVQRDDPQGLLGDFVLHHELPDLGLQPSNFGTTFGIETFAIDLQRVDSTAHELVGSLAILALRESILAGRFGNRDLTL